MAAMSTFLRSEKSSKQRGYNPSIYNGTVDNKYRCPQCSYILRNPVQTGCGERFCRPCADSLLREPNPICPLCNETLSQKMVFRDVFAEREVLALPVRCEHYHLGCKWQGHLRDLDEHMETCEPTTYDCPNKGCGKTLPMAEMKRHSRDECANRVVACDHCSQQVQFRHLEDHLQNVCSHKPLTCIQCKKTGIHKYKMEMHLAGECLRQVVSCQFHSYGCTEQFLREDQEKHDQEFAQKHLSYLMPTIHSLTQRLTVAEQQIKNSRKQEEQNANHISTQEDVFSMEQENRVQEMKQQMQENVQQKWKEELELWMGQQYEQRKEKMEHIMQLEVQQIQHEMQKELQQQTQRHQQEMQDQMQMQMQRHQQEMRQVLQRQQQMQDQIQQLTDGNLQREHESKISMGSTLTTLQATAEHTRGVTERQGNRLTSLEVQMAQITASISPCQAGQGTVVAEMPVADQRQDRSSVAPGRHNGLVRRTAGMAFRVNDIAQGTNGVLVWKIGDVSRLRQEAVSGRTPSLYSAPFYTSPAGYKMCTRIYLDGEGMNRGDYIGVVFILMRGEYDALLKWPFPLRATLMLMEQSGSEPGLRRNITTEFKPNWRSAFQRPVSEMNTGTNCPMFAPVTVLDNASYQYVNYVKDDTVFIKVVVDKASSRYTAPDTDCV